jgi:hypothetical protein
MDKLIITPKTKVHDLLEDYPELEEILVATAPPFKKLKNPVLRRTIARVTNLAQAATIANVNVEELVNTLRAKVGQDNISAMGDANQKYHTREPAWHASKNIARTIDISEMLNQGEQPVHEVLSAIKKLGDDEMLEIIAPFVPAPLLDKSLSLEYKHWLKKEKEDRYVVYFCK